MASGYYEPFAGGWLEEKTDLPIFEDFAVSHEPSPQDTQTLLQEFQNVCEVVGINQQQQQQQQYYQLTHLTPPQSPPFHAAPAPYHFHLPVEYPQPLPNNWQPVIDSLEPQTQTDLARELAVMDELVFRTAQDSACYERDIKPIPSPVSNESDTSNSDYYIPPFQYNKAQDFSQIVAPPEHTYAKSIEDNIQSGRFSPSNSSSSSVYGSSENDDDWGPSSSSSCASVSGRQKNYTRSKPYSRNPDDKRSRKKEQNKNAATRYRQKKKQEVEVLAGEEKELKDCQDALQGQCADLQREIRCLKGLMRDLFRAKGMIK